MSATTQVVPKSQEAIGLSVKFSNQQLTEMKEQRAMLASFVKSELRQNVDYGIIDGTGKNSLYKPGAEKLRKLFGLGSKIAEVQREIDIENNWVYFSYRIVIYDLRTGIEIGDSEGSANSQEKKYKSRPAADMINTIQKMAQKRAFVGAVIQATAASDFFVPDESDQDEPARPKGDSLPKPNQQSPMATSGQSKMVWAKLKSELGLTDILAREFIKKYSGKDSSRDLTAADVEVLLDQIEKAALGETATEAP
jgi:hypothetical protein